MTARRFLGRKLSARSRLGLRMLALGAVLALVLAACGGDDDDSSSNAAATTAAKSTTTASSGPATVMVATTSVGKTLVDANGMTLYALEKDSKDTSTCTAGCATAWPPLLVTGKVVVGQGLDDDDYGTFTRSDPAGTQVTAYGMPLYRFSGDKAPGDTNGKSIPNWYVVGANGKPMENAGGSAAPTTTTATSGSSSGIGY